MPLYEYECAACHRRTEKIQKFSDAELTVCPYCGGSLERTLTAPNVQFKGGGWYKDLYSSAKPAASGGTGEASGSGSGASDAAAAGGASAPAASSGGSTETAKPASTAPASAAPATAAASATGTKS